MGVCTDEGVGKIHSVPLKNTLSQILEIDLMNNADARRDHAESVKRLSSPLEKAISLLVAAKLDLHVPLKC